MRAQDYEKLIDFIVRASSNALHGDLFSHTLGYVESEEDLRDALETWIAEVEPNVEDELGEELDRAQELLESSPTDAGVGLATAVGLRDPELHGLVFGWLLRSDKERALKYVDEFEKKFGKEFHWQILGTESFPEDDEEEDVEFPMTGFSIAAMVFEDHE